MNMLNASGAVRWRSYLRRIAVASVVVACGAIAFAPTPTATEAAWADSEVAEASFTALTVPQPVAVDCAYDGGLLGLAAAWNRVQWKLPSGYQQTDIEFGYLDGNTVNQLLSNLVGNIATTQSGDIFTTQVTTLLAVNIFSSSRTIALRTVDPSGWKSDWVLAQGNSSTLGTNSGCVISTSPSID